jgi:hypothetical protein
LFRLDLPGLSSFLASRSAQLQEIAAGAILLSASSRALSQVIAAEGLETERDIFVLLASLERTADRS